MFLINKINKVVIDVSTTCLSCVDQPMSVDCQSKYSTGPSTVMSLEHTRKHCLAI